MKPMPTRLRLEWNRAQNGRCIVTAYEACCKHQFGYVLPLKADVVRRLCWAVLVEDLPGWANLAIGDCLMRSYTISMLRHRSRIDIAHCA